jgi:tRNA 2-selenouridine synthase
MPKAISPQDFLTKAQTFPVIDVRSPGEYDYAHIPSAVNIPLFDNPERAAVGTLYKQVGQDAAILKGLEFVGPKLVSFVKRARKLNPEGREVLVHCWRGGMRSNYFAMLLEATGMKVSIMAGGYKAYRQMILASFKESKKVIVLGGKTGSGKTDVLRELQKAGEQVIDLEGIAHHKGSSFGALGEKLQPTSEMFDNLFFEEWKKLDPTKRIWLEDESKNIGTVFLNEDIYGNIRKNDVVFLDIPLQSRIDFLVKEYGQYEIAGAKAALERIQKRLGGQHYQAAIKALDEGNFAEVAKISLYYYDKAYLHGLSLREQNKVYYLEAKEVNAQENAQLLIQWANANCCH